MLGRSVLSLFLLLMTASASAEATQGRWSLDLSMEGDYPVIFARIEGREEPIRLIVDTAAGGTVIDSSMATSLGLGVDESIQVRGANGTTAAQRAAKPTFVTIGSNLKLQIQPVLTDMSRFSKEGIHYDGILGNDVLSRFDVRFDVPEGHLIMALPGTFPNLLDGLRCEDNLRPTQSAPALAGFTMLDVTLRLDGPQGREIVARAVLDTGAAATVVNTQAARALGVMEGDDRLKPFERGTRGFGEGAIKTEILELSQIGFSEIQMLNTSVRVSELPVFEVLGIASRPAAILGIDLLRQIPVGTTAGASRVCFGEKS